MGHLRGLCPSTVYSLRCGSTFRLLVTAHLSTRYASGHIGVMAPSLFGTFPAPRGVTGTSVDSIRGLVGAYNLCGAGTGSLIGVNGKVYRGFNKGIPSAVRRLAALTNINEGATGLIIKSVCRGPTIIYSARFVELYGHLKLIGAAGPLAIRGTVQGLLPDSGSGSFYREDILFNESIYATQGPGYSTYILTSVYPGVGSWTLDGWAIFVGWGEFPASFLELKVFIFIASGDGDAGECAF